MGYTHYWSQRRPFKEGEWKTIVTEAKKIVDAAIAKGIPIVNGNGDAGTQPQINSDWICLNGVNDDSHETFQMTRAHIESFAFCKTARKPYDEVVVSILAVVKEAAPGACEISSDGGDEAIVRTL